MSTRNTLDGYHKMKCRRDRQIKTIWQVRVRFVYLLGTMGFMVRRCRVALVFDHLPIF